MFNPIGRRVFQSCGGSVRRALLGLFLLLAVLAPYAEGLTAALGGSDLDCGMACCKRTKSCCCRRSGDVGEHWKAASACPPGCRRAPGVAGSAAPAVMANPTFAGKVDPYVPLIVSAVAISRSNGIPAVLFQRPPPVS
ncbi:MAG: hypothetical protein JSU00_17245 [Acidobacteria bacterium]|nr:hypothetical protein [Acidobacteriota bacterium]